MRLLALEAYYDGSHRAFLDGWRTHSRHDWTVRSLPGYKWKWRMRHGAITFAHDLAAAPVPVPLPAVLLCSDMLNLAEFRGLAPAWARTCPTVLYFHENQLTYPVRHAQERDYQYVLTNLTSALAADAVWFNSHYHRETFLAALDAFLRRMPDHQPVHAVQLIAAKSTVQAPGIPVLPPSAPRAGGGPLHILWAARWEHDKNPEDFFTALDLLADRGVPFRVSVIGQHFRDVPPVFRAARERHAARIMHWGYQTSRAAYETVLAEADVIVSTAHHEFFGIGVAEAVAAGARPLLPRRLAYPELLGLDRHPDAATCFYDGSVADLTARLTTLATARGQGPLPSLDALQRRIKTLTWPHRAAALDRALAAAVAALVPRADPGIMPPDSPATQWKDPG